jgi:hypothetical protein
LKHQWFTILPIQKSNGCIVASIQRGSIGRLTR